MIYILKNINEKDMECFSGLNLPFFLPEKTKASVYSNMARGLLCCAVKKEFGINMPSIAYEDNGKPYFPERSDVFFNLSHTTGLIACALHNKPCGIDVEYIRTVSGKLIDRVCSPFEKAEILKSRDINTEFTKYWCLKESYVKAIGKGISFSLKNINFIIGENSVISSDPSYEFALSSPLDGYLLAVCKKL